MYHKTSIVKDQTCICDPYSLLCDVASTSYLGFVACPERAQLWREVQRLDEIKIQHVELSI